MLTLLVFLVKVETLIGVAPGSLILVNRGRRQLLLYALKKDAVPQGFQDILIVVLILILIIILILILIVVLVLVLVFGINIT